MSRYADTPAKGIDADRSDDHAKRFNILGVLQSIGQELFVPLFAQPSGIRANLMDHFNNRNGEDSVGIVLAVNSRGRQGGFALRTQVTLASFPYFGGNRDPGDESRAR